MSTTSTTPVHEQVPPDNANLFDQQFFGIDRHELIAEAAWSLLTSARARQEIRSILDRLEAGSLGDVAGWADRLKGSSPPDNNPETRRFLDDARNRNHASWHYVNLPLELTGYSREQHPAFTNDDDVVQMIQHCLRVLFGYAAPARFPASDRFSPANALRLLVHLVGDIHQPIHVACGYIEPIAGPVAARIVRAPQEITQKQLKSDKGGNELILPISGNRTLHAYWDSELRTDDHDHVHDDLQADAEEPPARYRAAPATRARYVEEVYKAVLQSDAASGAPDGAAEDEGSGDLLSLPVQWANESLLAARGAYQTLEISGRHSDGKKYVVNWEGKSAYDARNKPVMRQQLERASRNLARLLDAIWSQ